MTKEIVLITGANKGIGFESARQLAQKGYKVLLGARNPALGEAAAATLIGEGLDVEAITINVVDAASVAAAASLVESKYGRLDVLVNNAGVFGAQFDPTNIDVALARNDFEVNFFGVITVSNAFIPLLRKSIGVPRIVNLSSTMGSHAGHADPTSPIYGKTVTPYNASKSALNMYTQNLAHALKGDGFKVNVGCPGWVKTDMGGPDALLEVSDGAKTTLYLATLGADGPTGGFFFQDQPNRW